MVQARSVLCYWGTREFGMRGRQIVERHRWKLLEEDKSEERPVGPALYTKIKLIPLVIPLREDEHGLSGIIPRSHYEMWGFLFFDFR